MKRGTDRLANRENVGLVVSVDVGDLEARWSAADNVVHRGLKRSVAHSGQYCNGATPRGGGDKVRSPVPGDITYHNERGLGQGRIGRWSSKGPVTVPEKNRQRLIARIRRNEVRVAIPIDIGRRHGDRGVGIRADRIVDTFGETSAKASQEDCQGMVVLVCNDHVDSSISVEIVGRYAVRLVMSSGIEACRGSERSSFFSKGNNEGRIAR